MEKKKNTQPWQSYNDLETKIDDHLNSQFLVLPVFSEKNMSNDASS